jgi:predicted MPP superfamily phosphohydrolase
VRRSVYILLAGILVGAVCLGDAFLEPYFRQVKQYTIQIPELPEAFEGIRILFVTDIHHGPNFSRKRLKRLVRQMNELNADLILFGGDYYQWGREYVEASFLELQQVESPLGKYGVLGNHDYWKGWEDFARRSMAEAGIESLDNRAFWIEKDGQRIRVGGVEDLQCGHPDIAPTLQNTSENDVVLLISHNPEFAEELRTPNIDLVLSGHTHGGQFSFFGLWEPFMTLKYGRKYMRGEVETPLTTVIISNGVGMVSVPLRFWARPDVLVLTLKAQV